MTHAMLLALAVAVPATDPAPESPPSPPTVVFVCEHGSAKSMLAAALFNDLAERRGLDLRAVSRGLTPDAALAPAVAKGLADDGVPLPTDAPQRLDDADVAGAVRVVTFGALEDAALPSSAEVWQVPAVSDGYPAARAVIAERVEALIGELAPKAEGPLSEP